MERESNHVLREVDGWLRRVAIIGPIVTFMFGWGSGLLTAAILYKDHEKRIQSLEQIREINSERIVNLEYAAGIRKKPQP